ncbi:hypothetical protein [Brachybacterium sacelli]|uniref:hypothetical protein n=1 Tax=Brachybacterium sacelli TaxID=173364 RepID=UPI0036063C41
MAHRTGRTNDDPVVTDRDTVRRWGRYADATAMGAYHGQANTRPGAYERRSRTSTRADPRPSSLNG